MYIVLKDTRKFFRFSGGGGFKQPLIIRIKTSLDQEHYQVFIIYTEGTFFKVKYYFLISEINLKCGFFGLKYTVVYLSMLIVETQKNSL